VASHLSERSSECVEGCCFCPSPRRPWSARSLLRRHRRPAASASPSVPITRTAHSAVSVALALGRTAAAPTTTARRRTAATSSFGSRTQSPARTARTKEPMTAEAPFLSLLSLQFFGSLSRRAETDWDVSSTTATATGCLGPVRESGTSYPDWAHKPTSSIHRRRERISSPARHPEHRGSLAPRGGHRCRRW
jgi:hypothetical protein